MGGSASTHRIPGSQYFDGAWSTGSGATCEVIDPATETLLADLFGELILRYTAEWDRRLEGEILAGDTPGEVIHLLRAPIGVVSAICPWNPTLARRPRGGS
jgi:Aldehyde dehydrogenase family